MNLCQCGCGRNVTPGKRYVVGHPGRPKTTIQDILIKLIICEPTSLSTGCWEWPGYTDKDGYGTVGINRKQYKVHRVVYEHFVCPIPENVVCDHLCRNPKCCNFEHIDPVPTKINLLRGVGWGAKNAAKTHCNQGHEFTKENTRIPLGGGRVCKTCQRIATREHRAKMTHCIRGHELTPENTYIRPCDGARQCQQCRKKNIDRLVVQCHQMNVNRRAERDQKCQTPPSI